MQNPSTTTNAREIALADVMKSAWIYESAAKLSARIVSEETAEYLDTTRGAFTDALKKLYLLPH